MPGKGCGDHRLAGEQVRGLLIAHHRKAIRPDPPNDVKPQQIKTLRLKLLHRLVGRCGDDGDEFFDKGGGVFHVLAP